MPQPPRKRPSHLGFLPTLTLLVATAALAAATIAARTPEAAAGSEDGLDPARIQAEVNERFGVAASELLSLRIDAGAGEAFRLDFAVDGEPMTLDIAPHSVLAPDYRLLVQGEDGMVRDAAPGPVRTFRGTVVGEPDSIVAGGFSAHGTIAAIIQIPGRERIALEAVADRAADLPGVAADQYIVYREQDILPHAGGCGLIHEIEEFDAGGGDPQGGVAGTEVFSCAELACDADVEFYQFWGSDVVEVESRIQLVVNTVNIQYESQVDISHILTAIVVRTAEPDPYSFTESFALLSQFRDEWLNNMTDIPRDVAHLFTGKDIDGGVIGRAWTIGGICTDDAYCVSQSDFNGSFVCATDLTAHELGHLWNAFHCSCPEFTMNPGITCANVFTAGTISSIIAHRDSRDCLSLCSGATTSLPFCDMFDSLSLSPELWLGIEGAEVNDEASNPPSEPFALSLDGDDEIRSARMNGGNVIELILTYQWQRTGGGDSPEPGEDLVVEFEDTNLVWIEVNRHAGDGPDMTTFEAAQVVLPDEAFHSSFRFRFRNSSANAGFDDFYVDDVKVDGIVQAENDMCDDAPLLLDESSVVFSTLGATPDGFDESGTCGFDPENDVWYRHFAVCEGTLRVTISDSDYDHAVAVYSDLFCPTGADEAIACLEAPATEVEIPVTAAQAIRIRIGGIDGAKGSGTLTVSCDDTPPGCVEDCAEPEDGTVNTVDLLALLAQWGGPGNCAFTPENNIVDVNDLLAMLSAWGSDCE